MKDPNDSFLKSRIKSLNYALKGAYLLIRTEPSIQIQISIALIMTIAGFLFHLTATEWILQLLAIGLILVAESLNTGIEKLSDFVHPNYHKDIGFIKDISAGASTFAAVIAVIIGLIIYLPKIF